MTDTGVLAALAILLLFVGAMVMVRRRSRREARTGGTIARRAERDDAIDYRTLEQAEREVRDIEDNGAGGPPDHSLGDDWGPGTPRPPHRL